MKPCPFCGQLPKVHDTGHAECVNRECLHSQLAFKITDWNRRAADGWIKVEDRLPEIEKAYLVCDVRSIFKKPEVVKCWFRRGRFDGYENATHWRELPEAPK